ncbi:unnamed protein product [Gordionus sp. m RMFG-2023]
MFASRGLNKILFLSIAIYCATKDLSSAKSVCKTERNITLKKIHGNYSLNWDEYPIAERYYVEIYHYKKISVSRKEFLTKKNNNDLSIGELEKSKYEIDVFPYVKGDIWFHKCFGQNFTINSTDITKSADRFKIIGQLQFSLLAKQSHLLKGPWEI